MKVGMIGLGNIGGHVARNLVADGHDVIAHDVDPGRTAAIAGATAALTVTAVAADSEITILSLPTPSVVSAVTDEWSAAAPPGSVLVDLSTNDPDVVRRLGGKLAASGHHLVEAPLTGGAVGAEKRSLVFMVGGDPDPVARVLPVIEPLGRATFHVGELGLGNTIKLVNSLIAFTTAWVSLEGLSIAKKAGIEVAAAVEVLRTATGGNYFLNQQVEGIDTRGRPTQFALELAAKDAALIVDRGEQLGMPTPAGSAVLGVLSQAVADGLGGADWSDLVSAAELQAGVELRWDPVT